MNFEPGAGAFQLLLLLLFLIPVILFTISQQNTLKAIRPENRTMRPGEVWLQFVPLLGVVWQFVVVIRISDSLRNEFRARVEEEANRGIPDPALLQLAGTRPTHDIGISYCALFLCALFPMVGVLAAFAGMVCWILYWNKLNRYKTWLERN